VIELVIVYNLKQRKLPRLEPDYSQALLTLFTKFHRFKIIKFIKKITSSKFTTITLETVFCLKELSKLREYEIRVSPTVQHFYLFSDFAGGLIT